VTQIIRKRGIASPVPEFVRAKGSSMSLASRFNKSAFGRFLNSPAGRLFRLANGAFFVVLGIWLGLTPAGLASAAWGALAISAGGFDVCYISAALGGPFRGDACRAAAAPSRG
jgi:hypothetical protein